MGSLYSWEFLGIPKNSKSSLNWSLTLPKAPSNSKLLKSELICIVGIFWEFLGIPRKLGIQFSSVLKYWWVRDQLPTQWRVFSCFMQKCKCVTFKLAWLLCYSWPLCHLIPSNSFSLPLLLIACSCSVFIQS